MLLSAAVLTLSQIDVFRQLPREERRCLAFCGVAAHRVAPSRTTQLGFLLAHVISAFSESKQCSGIGASAMPTGVLSVGGSASLILNKSSNPT